MNQDHFIIQGKGGVGKSFASSVLSQYLKYKGDDTYCADTDPVNNTLSRYLALNAKTYNILNNENNIDSRVFDSLIEAVVSHQGHSVIDNGAATFVPLSAYLLENGVYDLLKENGREMVIHSIVTGGQGMDDTLVGLNSVLSNQKAQIVIWENEYYGPVEKDGKKLEDFKIIKQHADRIKGIVTLHKRNADTFGKDVELMVKSQLTFDEALQSSTFGLMPRQRLKMIKQSLFEQLDAIQW